jgi:nitrilase
MDAASPHSPAHVRVAVVQPRGFPFDRAGAMAEVEHRTREAAQAGARLVLFPEAFLGGYPWGLRFGTAIGGRSPGGKALYRRYAEAAIELPGPETRALGALARETGVHLSVGAIERLPGRASTLYCTQFHLGPDGELLGLHRKLKPTAAERLVWGEGDGSTLPVVPTPFGRVGGLICWENYMPLARMALYGKGVEIYLAPTADARDRWQATLRHIAVEGRCFVLGCNQFVTRDHYPASLLEDEVAGPTAREELAEWPSLLSPGGSVIVAPDGEVVAGPLLGEPGVLMADLSLALLQEQRLEFDVVGHYARPDVFRLEVDERPHPAVAYRTPAATSPAQAAGPPPRGEQAIRGDEAS